MNLVRLTLVSASPRRRELLSRLGLPFDVAPSRVAERWSEGNAVGLARLNARRKVAGSEHYGDWKRVLIGADTIIAFDRRVFGKPAGEDSARRMLGALSGREHRVITGVCISGPSRDSFDLIRVDCAAESSVRFRVLSELDIEMYVRTREWEGKAGGYAIQGAGGALVEALDGDFENVVGLPVGLIHDLISRQFGHCRFL